MRYLGLEKYSNSLLLLSRLLIAMLFIIFGWNKMVDFHSTIGYMMHVGAPLPTISAIIAVVVEFLFGIFILLGFYTRPLALIFAIYTIATGIIGHPFWNMSGMDAYAAMINFYKNVSIAGGFILLSITGPGKISLDKK